MPTDPTTLTELASATEAQLRAVVDPEWSDWDDWCAAVSAGLTTHAQTCGAERARTAKGERWLAELQRMAHEMSGLRIGVLGMCRADVLMQRFALVRRMQNDGTLDADGAPTPLGRAVLSLRLREQEGER